MTDDEVMLKLFRMTELESPLNIITISGNRLIGVTKIGVNFKENISVFFINERKFFDKIGYTII